MEMLLKICGSRQGLEVFGVRNNILIILSELLLFAPQVNLISLNQFFQPCLDYLSSSYETLLFNKHKFSLSF